MKRLLISLSLLAVVGATAFIYLRRKDPHAARSKVITSSKAPLAKLAPKELDELEVTAAPEGAPGGPTVAPVHVKVQRADATSWKVVEPFADVASPDAMQQALEGLEFVQWKAQVADSVEAMGKLGCNDEKGVHVVARAKGQVVADLYVCGELDRARLASSSQIWEVSGLDRWRFAKAAANRDTLGQLWKIGTNHIHKIAGEPGALFRRVHRRRREPRRLPVPRHPRRLADRA